MCLHQNRNNGRAVRNGSPVQKVDSCTGKDVRIAAGAHQGSNDVGITEGRGLGDRRP
jgi:hypothetical protein